MTLEQAQKIISQSLETQKRTSVLKVASELNPDFKNPHIVGGFVRDTLLNAPPRDCDVIFEGVQVNQPGVLEAVREAEIKLGLPQLSNWEFENVTAMGPSGNLYNDSIGIFSNHTDYLTLGLVNSDGRLSIGSDQTLDCLENRRYDIRYQGLLVWTAIRGRSYFRALTGVATRGLYLCQRLQLNPGPESQELFKSYDTIFGKLTPEERVSYIEIWNKKTKGIEKKEEILNRFGITALKQ